VRSEQLSISGPSDFDKFLTTFEKIIGLSKDRPSHGVRRKTFLSVSNFILAQQSDYPADKNESQCYYA
jgi:hypothetical protein